MLRVLQRIPWGLWYATRRYIRDTWATREWPEHVPTVELVGNEHWIERLFRQHHFEDVSNFSLQYEDEVHNLRRQFGTPDNPKELHVRTRRTNDTDWECIAHTEPSRWEQKERHIATNPNYVEWLTESELYDLLREVGINMERIA